MPMTVPIDGQGRPVIPLDADGYPDEVKCRRLAEDFKAQSGGWTRIQVNWMTLAVNTIFDHMRGARLAGIDELKRRLALEVKLEEYSQ